MSTAHVSRDTLRLAVRGLGEWYSQVPQQKSRHVWSLLPLKVAGANAGESLAYTEGDDRKFMERFMMPRDSPAAYPFFDPFSHAWLPAGYFHSNMATFRKNTFMRRWNACAWDGESAVLAEDYADIFADRVLKKGGTLTRVPALACAIWFYKEPSVEWPAEHPFRDGLPNAPAVILTQFRADFAFQDQQQFATIFDDDSVIDAHLRATVEAT